jgi:hypothetical protein
MLNDFLYGAESAPTALESGDGNYAPSPSGGGTAMTDLTVGISDPATWGEPEQVNPTNVLVEGDRLPADEDIVATLATAKPGADNDLPMRFRTALWRGSHVSLVAP